MSFASTRTEFLQSIEIIQQTQKFINIDVYYKQLYLQREQMGILLNVEYDDDDDDDDFD